MDQNELPAHQPLLALLYLLEGSDPEAINLLRSCEVRLQDTFDQTFEPGMDVHLTCRRAHYEELKKDYSVIRNHVIAAFEAVIESPICLVGHYSPSPDLSYWTKAPKLPQSSVDAEYTDLSQ